MPHIYLSKSQKEKRKFPQKSSGVIFTDKSKTSTKKPESHTGRTKDLDIQKKGTAENINPSFYSGLERDF